MSPQASNVDFTIDYATPDDVDELVRVHTAAFKTDQFSNLMLLGRADGAHEKLMRKTIEGWFSAEHNSIMKAFDASGRILGWSCLQIKATKEDAFLAASDKEQSKRRGSVDKTEEASKEPPAVEKEQQQEPSKDPVRALGGLMFKERMAIEDRYMKGKRYAVLQGLATDPAYQRRGIATKLVQIGVDEIDQHGGYPCWVHASPSSYGVYEKVGFEEVGRNEYNLDEWAPGEKGADDRWGRYIFRHMLRKEHPVNLEPESLIAKSGI